MYQINKFLNPILWTKTSECFYGVILKHVSNDFRILEVGSGTGHISYMLAKKYSITLNEIRKECLESSVEIFNKNGLNIDYINGDYRDINKTFDLSWNSGLVQCFNDNGKKIFIKNLSKISTRVLLFYPDTESKNKKLGNNKKIIPGVDDAKEYSIKGIPELMNKLFDRVEFGELSEKEVNLDYKMFWVYGEN